MLSLDVVVEAGGRLVLDEPPLIVAQGADVERRCSLTLEEGAIVALRETVVLGRDGESPGTLISVLRATLDGRALLHDGLRVSPGDDDAYVAHAPGHRVVATICLLGMRPVPSPPAIELRRPRRAAARDRGVPGRRRDRGRGDVAMLAQRRAIDHPLIDRRRGFISAQAGDHCGVMRLVVDNSSGGDAELASNVTAGLQARGHAVELREPEPESMFDTAVHVVSTGIVLRVDERPSGSALAEISEVVRDALSRHPSMRRRTRAVPVALGPGGRVLTWIDVFG